MLPIESIPDWLVNWAPGDPAPMHAWLRSNVVFYPGSGTDGQPVQFFAKAHAAHCYLYVDYGLTRQQLHDELSASGHPFNGYRSIGRVEVREQDLAPSGWTHHASPARAPAAPLVQQIPFAFLEVLERDPEFDTRHGPRRLAILFLCADGVATYDALFCQPDAAPPFALVVQDHGFGANWTSFGRDGELENLAVVNGRWPEFLLVGNNTKAWTGYTPVPDAIAANAGQHRFKRQLWRRD